MAIKYKKFEPTEYVMKIKKGRIIQEGLGLLQHKHLPFLHQDKNMLGKLISYEPPLFIVCSTGLYSPACFKIDLIVRGSRSPG